MTTPVLTEEAIAEGTARVEKVGCSPVCRDGCMLCHNSIIIDDGDSAPSWRLASIGRTREGGPA
jgi:hypothetical protein